MRPVRIPSPRMIRFRRGRDKFHHNTGDRTAHQSNPNDFSVSTPQGLDSALRMRRLCAGGVTNPGQDALVGWKRQNKTSRNRVYGSTVPVFDWLTPALESAPEKKRNVFIAGKMKEPTCRPYPGCDIPTDPFPRLTRSGDWLDRLHDSPNAREEV